MNREIKFRAWDRQGMKMMYKSFFDRNWYGTPKNDENGCHTIRKAMPEDRVMLELMQFTGLKDKSGKEIYEGDIVSRGDGNFVVQYKNDGHYIGYVATMDDKAQSYIHVWYDNIEIIGNIHESPNLLKP